MIPLVYLAGPITGLSYGETVGWRQKVRRALLPDIESLSPMRDTNHLSGEHAILDSYDTNVISTDHGIVTRDLSDLRRADLILINMLGASTKSQGTICEMAVAFERQKPIVLVMEPSGNPHEHAFTRVFAPLRVHTLPHAVEVIRSILLPG